MNTFRFRLPLLAAAILASACMKMPKTKIVDPDLPPPAEYIYPFGAENQFVTAEITLEFDTEAAARQALPQIPPLKYDKSLLVMLTQDDCKHAAFSVTWAAINGRPLSDTYYYNALQMRAGDLPPDIYTLGKTLGSTDGAGNEVRFSFTTTLSPEWEYMDNEVTVKPGYTENYYRFFMQAGLVWSNVTEMANYGVGMAFHDLDTQAAGVVDSLRAHYEIAQRIIRQHLDGRGCKMLAEPDGNKAYVEAAQLYAPIQTIVLQSGGETLRPFAVEDDLMKLPLLRTFAEPDYLCTMIDKQRENPAAEREAVSIGVHNTDRKWAEFLLWLNDTYGQDGEDCLWMPSHEEYFEYNYLRRHAEITTRQEGNKLVIRVSMPGGLYFYYPSLTLLIGDVKASECRSVGAGEMVTGLSWGENEDGTLLVNFDCRHALGDLAEHFVDLYEHDNSAANLADARYFVGKLRPSDRKNSLLRRLK